MWRKKDYPKYGFCGCPPCGLCFDWVEPAPPEAPKEEVTVIDGLDKMAMDITGKTDPDTVTTTERGAMQEYCEGVHERRMTDTLGPKPIDPDAIALTPPEEMLWIDRQIKEKRLAKESEKAYQAARNKPKSLDEMGWGEEQRKAEQDEELKKKADEEAKLQKRKDDKKAYQDAFDRMRNRY